VIARRGPAPAGRLTRQALQATAPLLSAVARLSDVAHTQEQAIRGALLDDLAQGGSASELHALAARAESFGVDFSEPARAVVLAPHPRRDGEHAPVDVRREALETALLGARLPHLIARRGARIIALAQGDPDELRAAAADVIEGKPALVAGIGRPVTSVEEVGHSLRDAELAVERVGHEFERRLLDFEEFDLGTLLISEAPLERIGPKIDELRDVLRSHPRLYEALVAWFEHDMDVGAAAGALHLHPNSVRYRLGRVERLLGRSLRQPSTITALYIVITLPFDGP
jgi:purine catabolism regulator